MGAACAQVPGINHYEVVIEAVYDYWRGKHRRAGRPLIQRLWYEPPWDRKKAAQRLASSAADGEGGAGGAAADDGPFYAQDSPVALAGIRKRRMDPEEAKTRFQEIRCAAYSPGRPGSQHYHYHACCLTPSDSPFPRLLCPPPPAGVT